MSRTSGAALGLAVVVAVALSSMGATTALPQHRAPYMGMAYGNTLAGASDAELAAALDDAVHLGLSTVRVDLRWNDVHGVAFHPYTYPASPTESAAEGGPWSKIDRGADSLRAVMERHGRGALPIWLTEFGAPTGGPGQASEASAVPSDVTHVTEERAGAHRRRRRRQGRGRPGYRRHGLVSRPGPVRGRLDQPQLLRSAPP